MITTSMGHFRHLNNLGSDDCTNRLPVSRLSSADENKFLTERTAQEMIEFLTRISLVGLSKTAQLHLTAFIEGFAKVCY